MYYTAFFADFRPFVRISLCKFLENDFTDTWINNNGIVSQFSSEILLPSLDDNPIFLPNVGEIQSWHIYGEQKSKFNWSENIIFPPKNRISLQKIDELYQYLSYKYSWCFFPWGSVGSFFGFAFVSSNQDFRDKFINIVDNLDALIKYPNTPDRKPRCISSYNVAQNLSQSIQCIIINIPLL